MPAPQLITVLLAVCMAVIPCRQASAQSKRAAAGASPLCTQENALETIRQQIAFTRTFDDSVRRLKVLIRAADLLWPYQQGKARAAFTEAFELAIEVEKETDQKGPRSLLRMQTKIDLNHSISILGDAINCINRVETPDFSGEPSMEKKPARRGRGGRYEGEYLLWFYMPGLDPESAFREMAKIDFDNAFSLSSTVTDKFQRAVSTLAVAETCLGHRSTRKPRM